MSSPTWSSTRGGNLIVAPTDDTHEFAASALTRQAVLQLSHTVSCNGFAWVVPGGSGYLMIPDLADLVKDWHRVDRASISTPRPSSVVEIRLTLDQARRPEPEAGRG